MPVDCGKPTVLFRAWQDDDRETCLSIFDANCPAFFAPNERIDFARFLDTAPGGYEVCEMAERVVGAFGLFKRGDGGASLNWIMIDPCVQGTGIGSAMMQRVFSLATASELASIDIAASHKSASFFERFGAVATARIKDGWGPGMDRVNMELRL